MSTLAHYRPIRGTSPSVRTCLVPVHSQKNMLTLGADLQLSLLVQSRLMDVAQQGAVGKARAQGESCSCACSICSSRHLSLHGKVVRACRICFTSRAQR